jgi:hypothetical protein
MLHLHLPERATALDEVVGLNDCAARVGHGEALRSAARAGGSQPSFNMSELKGRALSCGVMALPSKTRLFPCPIRRMELPGRYPGWDEESIEFKSTCIVIIRLYLVY